MDLAEIQCLIDEQQQELPIPRRQEKKVVHQTRVGEIVYSFLKGRKCPLLYQKSFDLENHILSKGLDGWMVDSKLKSIMEWGKQHNAHPLALVSIINKELKK